MGYLFLSAALIFGAVKGFCGKKMSGYTTNLYSAALINLLRMAVCVLISFCVVIISGNINNLAVSEKLLAASALAGISTASFIVTWLLSIKKSAYMMLDVFLMLGTLVPIISGQFLFSETITLRKIIGFVILVAAVLIMCSYNNSIKAKFTPAAVILLIICGLSNGVTDLSQKIATKTIDGLSVEMFNFYTYVFAALALLIFLAFIPRKENTDNEKLTAAPVIYVLIMAGALTANSYFKTQAAFYLPSVELYPLSQGLSLILSTFMSTVFFKERLKASAIIGITLAFIALMIINL